MSRQKRRYMSTERMRAELRKLGYNPSVIYSGRYKDGTELITFSYRGRRVVARAEGNRIRILTDMAEEDAQFLLYEVIGRERPKFKFIEDDDEPQDDKKADPMPEPPSRIQKLLRRKRPITVQDILDADSEESEA